MAAFSSDAFSTDAFSISAFDFGDVPPVTVIIGGAGRPYRLRRRKETKELVYEAFDLTVREMFERVVVEEAIELPPAMKQDMSGEVDWSAVEQDVATTRSILMAWERQEAKRLDDEIEAEDMQILFPGRTLH